ncbi:hypothetical protein BC938DRAFT_471721 [Jimgerdemannia flammicorona]|uniref:F-box domain-containing protein n=1 Tax=Jimgerdemannia flammicorona TaxID=994334 RepID=A0A433Q7K2_9FUNG|nr:hypothetical protein BC938DRAFT_471721 [Jimgerdemannia flammicorona]
MSAKTWSDWGTLPLEVLSMILSNFHRRLRFADLLASSMVCREWYVQARRLIDDRIFQNFLASDNYVFEDIQRIPSLLAKSKRLGLDFLNLIEEMTICPVFADDDEFEGFVEAYATVLHLQPPNLTRLQIHLGNENLTPEYFRWLFDRLEPLCGGIRSVHFRGHTGSTISTLFMNVIRHYASVSRLAVFLRSVAPNLETLSFSNMSLDSRWCNSMSACSSLRELRIDGAIVENLAPVLGFLLNMSKFCYTCEHEGYWDAAMVIAALSHPRLTDLTYECTHSLDEPTVPVEALCDALRQCPLLERLKLSGTLLVDDAFLSALLKEGRELKHIELEWSNRLVGNAVVWNREAGWPRARTVSLYGCDNVIWQFLHSMQVACPKLEIMKLPDHMLDGNFV